MSVATLPPGGLESVVVSGRPWQGRPVVPVGGNYAPWWGEVAMAGLMVALRRFGGAVYHEKKLGTAALKRPTYAIEFATCENPDMRHCYERSSKP